MSTALAGTCAARLAGQRPLAAFGLLLSACAWVGLGLWSTGSAAIHPIAAVALAGTALAGLVERYLAMRLIIDAQLFGTLAQTATAGLAADLAALDDALGALRIAPSGKAGRALAARAEGAMRLVRWHTDAVALQALLLAAACIAAKTVASTAV